MSFFERQRQKAEAARADAARIAEARKEDEIMGEKVPYDLDSLELEEEATQEECDVIAKIEPADLLVILHRQIPKELVYMSAEVVMSLFPNPDKARSMMPLLAPLYRKSMNSVRAAINRIVTAFKPTTDDGKWQKLRNGAYERGAGGDLIERKPAPLIAYTCVDEKDVPMARLVMCSIAEREEKVVGINSSLTRTTVVKNANEKFVFKNADAHLAIGANLYRYRKGTTVPLWGWDLMATALTKDSVSTTGLSPLYFAYKGVASTFTPAEKMEMPSLGEMIDYVGKFSIPRESLPAFTTNSVWYLGSPVGSSQVIASTLEFFFPEKSIAGNFSSKLIPWLTKRKLFMPSIRSHEVASKLEVTSVAADVVHNTVADIYWNPAKEHLKSLNCSVIALPLTNVTNTVMMAQAWMNDTDEYYTVISYGPMPVLWVAKTTAGRGEKKANVCAVAERLCCSASWIGIYNLSCAFAGQLDAFAFIHAPNLATEEQLQKLGPFVGGTLVNLLAGYKYCPMQKKAGILGKMDWDTVEVSFSASKFAKPRELPVIPMSPSYTPPEDERPAKHQRTQ